MTSYESIGDNCEFAAVQERMGNTEGGLLKWAHSDRFDLLVEAFNNRFSNLFEFDNLTPWNPWMVLDNRYRIAFRSVIHSEQRNGVFEFVEIETERREKYKADFSKFMSLKDRLIVKLESAESIFVYKRNDISVREYENPRMNDPDFLRNRLNASGVTVYEALLLLAALKRYNPANKLLVVATDCGMRPGTVREVHQDLYFGCIEQLASYYYALGGLDETWGKILNNMEALIHA